LWRRSHLLDDGRSTSEHTFLRDLEFYPTAGAHDGPAARYPLAELLFQTTVPTLY
jgi:hypothetical protein